MLVCSNYNKLAQVTTTQATASVHLALVMNMQAANLAAKSSSMQTVIAVASGMIAAFIHAAMIVAHKAKGSLVTATITHMFAHPLLTFGMFILGKTVEKLCMKLAGYLRKVMTAHVQA